MNIHDQLKDFIRNTLGCGCPEEVFERMGISEQGKFARIAVGGRLLIYLAQPGVEKPDLVQLLRWGQKDRDELGFNRFRLVLPTSKHDGEQRRLFADTQKGDDKLHLHIIQAEEHARISALCKQVKNN